MSAQVGESRLIPEWSLGDRLRKIRRMTGDGQAEFAAKIGANQKSYAAWELDYNAPRNLVAVAKRIEAMTSVPAGWVLGVDATSDVPGNLNREYASDSGNVVRLFPQLRRHGGTTVRRALDRTCEVSPVAS